AVIFRFVAPAPNFALFVLFIRKRRPHFMSARISRRSTVLAANEGDRSSSLFKSTNILTFLRPSEDWRHARVLRSSKRNSALRRNRSRLYESACYAYISRPPTGFIVTFGDCEPLSRPAVISANAD